MDLQQVTEQLKVFTTRLSGVGRRFGQLVIILSISYVAASSTSAYLMSVMLDSVIRSFGKGQTQAITASLDSGQRPNYRNIRKTILDRNMFNEDGEFPDESTPDVEQEETKTKGDFDPNAECKKTTLNLTLKGTIYLDKGENSLAIIQDKEYTEVDIYRVGDAVIGNDSAAIAAIMRKFVVINNSGVKECIELDDGLKIAKSDGFPTLNPSAPLQDASGPAGKDPVEEPASDTGGTCLLEEKFVLEQLGDGFSKIIQQARLVPNVTGGNMNGFKIFAIDKGGLWGKVGFQNGDIIIQVNDTSLKQPEQGFALYQAFQEEREVRIELLRKGTIPTSIVCRVK